MWLKSYPMIERMFLHWCSAPQVRRYGPIHFSLMLWTFLVFALLANSILSSVIVDRNDGKKKKNKKMTCVDMWHVTLDMWHVTCDTRHVTCDMWHMTCAMFWGVNILSKFQLPSSYVLWFMILWRSGGKGWLNWSVNYEAVNRTAPATPGLLLIIT